MFNDKPQKSLRAKLAVRGFAACTQAEARERMQTSDHDVLALFEWTESYPSGSSVGYAVCKARRAGGTELPSRGWDWKVGLIDLANNPNAKVSWFSRPWHWAKDVLRAVKTEWSETEERDVTVPLTDAEKIERFGSIEEWQIWATRFGGAAYLTVE